MAPSSDSWVSPFSNCFDLSGFFSRTRRKCSAAKLGMRELVKFADLGFEDVNGTVITTRSFIAQQRDVATRFMRAFIRGMHRYRNDKEYSKRVLGKYGKITEMVLGMEVVLPNGKVMRTKAVPNSAAGPNFNYLFMGAEGTLGIITEATLRISPLPEARRFAGLLFSDLPAAMNAARLIMRRGLRPAFMRISDELETTYFHKREGSQMILMFDGFSELCDVELSEALAVAGSLGARELGEAPSRQWWEQKRFSIAFPSSTHPLFGVPTPGHIRISGCIDSAGTFDYLVKVQRGLGEITREMQMFLGAHFSHFYPTGGMIYPTFVAEVKKGPECARAYEEVWRRGIELSHNLGGTINHHHGIGLNLGKFMHLELGEAGMETFSKIKRAMDPNNIMNPGKLGL